MRKIKNPQLKIIKTSPSTLGTVDYHIVIYDSTNLKDGLFDKFNEFEIAEEIYETGEFKGFYVIHSSSTRGADIIPLSDNHFSCNRINCDSILSYHCLAIKSNETELTLRTGFHEIHPSLNILHEVYDWDSMSTISNGFLEIEVDKHVFLKLYKKQIDEWKEKVTTCISNSIV
ncbi:hypothetical protein ACIVBQ_001090 [Tenacibaculum discolor]